MVDRIGDYLCLPFGLRCKQPLRVRLPLELHPLTRIYRTCGQLNEALRHEIIGYISFELLEQRNINSA